MKGYAIYIEHRGFFTRKRVIPPTGRYLERVYYNTSRTLNQSVKIYKSEKTAQNMLVKIQRGDSNIEPIEAHIVKLVKEVNE